MGMYYKVKSVEALPRKRLRVHFENGESRVYDCNRLLEEPSFRSLRDDAFFRNVRADPHGYGVLWNDDVDIAESELWIHGTSEQIAGERP